MTDRETLRRALVYIKSTPSAGLRWVSNETGIAVSKLHSFTGNDLLTPEDDALNDEEVKGLLEWYFFAGPT